MDTAPHTSCSRTLGRTFRGACGNVGCIGSIVRWPPLRRSLPSFAAEWGAVGGVVRLVVTLVRVRYGSLTSRCLCCASPGTTTTPTSRALLCLRRKVFRGVRVVGLLIGPSGRGCDRRLRLRLRVPSRFAGREMLRILLLRCGRSKSTGRTWAVDAVGVAECQKLLELAHRKDGVN